MITLQERVHAAPKPDDWQLDKLHQVFRGRRGNKNTGMKEDNLLSLSYGRIIQKDIETADGLLPENFEGYQIVEPGNIVLRLTDLQNDKRSLRQGLVTQRGIITSAYDSVEIQRDNDPRFWFYSLLALDLAKHYYSLGGGVRQSVKFADFPNDWVYRPDLATQRQIADFLDRETARIDLLIEKKQRLVPLLGEKFTEERRSLFYGDEERQDLALKFPFLMRLRSQWRVSKNARHFKIRMGETILSEAVSDDGRFPVYSATEQDVVFGYVDQTTALLKHGDLVVPARGNSIGHVKFVSSPATSTQTTIQLSCIDPNIQSEFAFCWMKSFKQYLFPFDRTAIPQITTEQVGRNPIPIADQRQQSEVSNAFRLLEDKEEELIKPIKSSIDRLKEYRSALITAAVTGQIDVTTFAKSGTPDRRLDAIQEEMGA